MLYFKINERFEVIAIQPEFPEECLGQNPAWARDAQGNYGAGWLNRCDISDYPAAPRMFAQVIAEAATKFAGRQFLMVDKGEYCNPRYDVVEAPQVGAEVSMAFNGDYYPVGKIVKIGKGYKQIKVEGPEGPKVFYRQKESASWLNNKYWSLVPGVINRWNPEF